jgi:cytochrome c-type biogenesis protein CcmH
MKVWAVFFFFFLSLPVLAGEDLYPFDLQGEREQFSSLTQEVRCLVCQNQAISDSNAPFAADLRGEIYTLVKQHKSNAEIKNHLTQRYGAYVLLQPPMAKQTWVLWAAPFLLLVVGAGVLYQVVSKKS